MRRLRRMCAESQNSQQRKREWIQEKIINIKYVKNKKSEVRKETK